MITGMDEKIALNDGNRMPGFGYGCYKARGRELLAALAAAWEAGYRLFDTAAFYDNEETVGQGLAGYPAEEYFLISKIWPTDFDRPAEALAASLKKLGRDCLDGYLLHWPGPDEKRMLTAWEAFLREKEKGRIRSLGASNFLERHLEAVNREFGHFPAINQIESHPFFSHRDLAGYCRHRSIAVMAWAPLGRGDAMRNATILEIAADARKTPAQVILRWQIQGGKVAIPKSVHPARIRENADVFDFALTDGQMRAIDSLDRPSGNFGANPATFAG